MCKLLLFQIVFADIRHPIFFRHAPESLFHVIATNNADTI